MSKKLVKRRLRTAPITYKLHADGKIDEQVEDSPSDKTPDTDKSSDADTPADPKKTPDS